MFFIFLMIFSWLVGLYWILLLLFVGLAILLFFSRRLSPAFKEDGVLKEGIFYSPVNGKVVAINNNFQHKDLGEGTKEVIIVSAWWREHGIYFPMKSEVNSFSYIGNKGHFRYLYRSVFEGTEKRSPSLTLGLKCSNSSSFSIDFYKCPLGLWPKLITIPGDRGKAQVNMGFFGLGGTTVLYLPSDFELTLKEGSDIIAGQTIIARTTEVVKVDR